MNDNASNCDDWFEHSTHRYQLLHIEDSMADQMLVREVLEQANETYYHLTQVPSMAKAEQLAKEPSHPHFDIVLLDLNLPDSQGLDSLQQTLKLYPSTPIIVLTGFERDTLGLQAISMGAEDYISKSQVTNADLLIKTIQYAIARANRPVVSGQETEQQTESHNNYYLSDDSEDDRPLRNTDPDLFMSLCKNQQELITVYTDSTNSSDKRKQIEQLIKTIIHKLGDAKAEPSDLIDVNKTALGNRCRDESPTRAAQLKENNRELLLNMLTQLSLWYSQET
ncbi:response regulator [Celerinatantimonas sp. MCCC 1A17872]|uniref:response regulator n=1 Tax=Celerinatantimonas sp. MCCC 1A17872 TaxID=3177514 RepID=UPI0038C96CA4